MPLSYPKLSESDFKTVFLVWDALRKTKCTNCRELDENEEDEAEESGAEAAVVTAGQAAEDEEDGGCGLVLANTFRCMKCYAKNSGNCKCSWVDSEYLASGAFAKC